MKTENTKTTQVNTAVNSIRPLTIAERQLVGDYLLEEYEEGRLSALELGRWLHKIDVEKRNAEGLNILVAIRKKYYRFITEKELLENIVNFEDIANVYERNKERERILQEEHEMEQILKEEERVDYIVSIMGAYDG